MFEFLRRVAKCQKGAMDKILVTLLLVIIGVGAVIGIQQWVGGEVTDMQQSAQEKIDQASDSNTSN